MNHKFMNMLRLQASIVNNSKTMTSVGIVTGYDPTNYLVTVELYPQDNPSDSPALQTGWIPLFTPWAGSGWGMFLPPNIGDIIEVHYQDGSLQNAYAALRCFNFNELPDSVQSGEFWLIHQTGSFIKLTNDGNLTVSSGVNITIEATANVNITGSAEVNITAPVVNVDSAEVNLGSGSLSALLTGAAAAAFDTHTHTGSFVGNTSTPSTSMSSDLTTNTKAS